VIETEDFPSWELAHCAISRTVVAPSESSLTVKPNAVVAIGVDRRSTGAVVATGTG
jgi:hypothetical protein